VLRLSDVLYVPEDDLVDLDLARYRQRGEDLVDGHLWVDSFRAPNEVREALNVEEGDVAILILCGHAASVSADQS
jgi:hypothetical protein